MARLIPWRQKYRPTNFDEFVDQDDIKQALAAAIVTGRLDNYLFTGPPGQGKSVLAQLFAREYFRRHDALEDGKPPVWGYIFLPISSETGGVDTVKDLRMFARLTMPFASEQQGLFKIVILDEVDRFSPKAMEDLRHILEGQEPALAKTVFIGTTNYPDSVPEPVRQRFRIMEFRPVDTATIKDRLRQVLAAENCTVSENALDRVADDADGSLRSGLVKLQEACERVEAGEALEFIRAGKTKVEADDTAVLARWTLPTRAPTEEEIRRLLAVVQHRAGLVRYDDKDQTLKPVNRYLYKGRRFTPQEFTDYLMAAAGRRQNLGEIIESAGVEEKRAPSVGLAAFGVAPAPPPRAPPPPGVRPFELVEAKPSLDMARKEVLAFLADGTPHTGSSIVYELTDFEDDAVYALLDEMVRNGELLLLEGPPLGEASYRIPVLPTGPPLPPAAPPSPPLFAWPVWKWPVPWPQGSEKDHGPNEYRGRQQVAFDLARQDFWLPLIAKATGHQPEAEPGNPIGVVVSKDDWEVIRTQMFRDWSTLPAWTTDVTPGGTQVEVMVPADARELVRAELVRRLGHEPFVKYGRWLIHIERDWPLVRDIFLPWPDIVRRHNLPVPKVATPVTIGYTKVGITHSGTVPDLPGPQRFVYTPWGRGRIVGEDADNYYIVRLAGAAIEVHRHSKEFINRLERYFAVGSTVETYWGPAVITESPTFVPDLGMHQGKARLTSGEIRTFVKHQLKDFPTEAPAPITAPKFPPLPPPTAEENGHRRAEEEAEAAREEYEAEPEEVPPPHAPSPEEYPLPPDVEALPQVVRDRVVRGGYRLEDVESVSDYEKEGARVFVVTFRDRWGGEAITHLSLEGELVGDFTPQGLKPYAKTGQEPPPTPAISATVRLPTLKPEQEEAVQKMVATLRGSVIMPVGFGKSVTALAAWERLGRPRLLWVVPTRVLLEEMARTRLPGVGVDPHLIGAWYADEKRLAPITLTIYDSVALNPGILEGWPMIVFDEMHHLRESSNLSKIVPRIPSLPAVFGLTASIPEGSGAEDVLRALPILYRYDTLDAILEGGIAPVSVFWEPVTLTPEAWLKYEEADASVRKASHRFHGPPPTWMRQALQSGSEADVSLAHAGLAGMNRRTTIVSEAGSKLDRAAEIAESVPDSRVLVFSLRVEPIGELCRRLERRGVACRTITGKTPRDKRPGIIAQWGKTFKVLSSVHVLEEGLDIPEARVAIVMAGHGPGGKRPKGSGPASLEQKTREMEQRLGRVLRPREGKKAELHVLYVPNTVDMKMVNALANLLKVPLPEGRGMACVGPGAVPAPAPVEEEEEEEAPEEEAPTVVAEAAPPPPSVARLEPWQMHATAWASQLHPATISNGVVTVDVSDLSRDTLNEVDRLPGAEMYAPGPGKRAVDFKGITVEAARHLVEEAVTRSEGEPRARHKALVLRALAEGKQVPAFNLKAYPDLLKEPAGAPVPPEVEARPKYRPEDFPRFQEKPFPRIEFLRGEPARITTMPVPRHLLERFTVPSDAEVRQGLGGTVPPHLLDTLSHAREEVAAYDKALLAGDLSRRGALWGTLRGRLQLIQGALQRAAPPPVPAPKVAAPRAPVPSPQPPPVPGPTLPATWPAHLQEVFVVPTEEAILRARGWSALPLGVENLYRLVTTAHAEYQRAGQTGSIVERARTWGVVRQNLAALQRQVGASSVTSPVTPPPPPRALPPPGASPWARPELRDTIIRTILRLYDGVSRETFIEKVMHHYPVSRAEAERIAAGVEPDVYRFPGREGGEAEA